MVTTTTMIFYRSVLLESAKDCRRVRLVSFRTATPADGQTLQVSVM